MKTQEAEILVANTSAVFLHDGETYRIVAGRTTARRGSKLLKGREHLFRPLVVDFDMEGAASSLSRRRGGPPKEENVEAFEVDVPTVAPDMSGEQEKPRAVTTKSVKK